MKSTSQLSIGIPVYNQARTIAKTVEAALAQTVAPREVVVSDNHSDDGTKEILESFGNRIRLVRPPKHCSMGANWNFCARSCLGEWVGLCSGDDLLLPAYVKVFSDCIRRHPEAVFVMGGWENFNEITGKTSPHFLLSMKEVIDVPKTIKMHLYGPKASFASFCVKREAFDAVGGYDENYHLIQDWILQFDLSKLGRFINTRNILARYRISDRPVLESKRYALYIDDKIKYLSAKIWEAQDYGVSRREITRAAKTVLLQTLRGLKPDEEALAPQARQALAEIAIRVGAAGEWEQWKKGRILPRRASVIRKIKDLGRKIYNLSR